MAADPPRASGVFATREQRGSGDLVTFVIEGRGSLNVIGSDTLKRGAETVNSFAQDADVRCAVLRGPTARAWIGGADLQELGAITPANAEAFIRNIHDFCSVLREFPVPVIARIQGYCLGGGLEIAAACDLRVSDASGRFGMPEVRIGVPSVIEAALLPQLIGWGRTRELLYRGHILDAAEAARIGLVEHAVAPAALDAAVQAIVADIAAGAPQAIRAQKRLIRTWEQLPLAAAIEAGVGAFVAAYATDEPARYTAEFFAARPRKP